MATKINFTKAELTRIATEGKGKRETYHDTKTRGLIAEQRPGGSLVFYLYKRLRGRPTRFKLGAFPDLTVEQARNAAAEKIGEAAKGIDIAGERRAVRATWTLDELFSHYLETHAKPRKRSWQLDEANFKRYLTGWKNRRLDQIGRREVAAFHAKLGTDIGHTTANRILALLSKMFSEAARAGYPCENPCRNVARFREVRKERFITAAELPKLFAAIEAEPDQLMADAALLALFTGARRGNVLTARWDEIDFAAGVWVIPAHKSKGGRAIDVPLGAPSVEVLKRRQEESAGSEWVFPSRGKSGHVVEIKSAWKRICTAAGLEGVRFHDLRHSYASWAVAAGVPLFTLGKALGHASQATTQRYAHLERSAVVAAASLTTGAMMAALEPPKKTSKKKGVKHASR